MINKIITPLIAAIAICSCSSPKSDLSDDMTLKDAFAGKFLMGVALNNGHYTGRDSIGASVAASHFNAIVAEDDMKCEKIHPEENTYYWKDSDRFVEFGEKNDMFIVGHCLVWHSQCAPWFFVDSLGNQVDAETLKNRLRSHIHTVVGRYKGRVNGWDVVNEAIVEDGSFRKSKFYEILGEDFIKLAFKYAHEADPDAELYINDYGMNVPGRRNAYVNLVNEMKAEGIRIDAIGMQGHMGIDYPDFRQFEKSIEAFASTGCKVMITELDMSVLPTIHEFANIADTVLFKNGMNPYVESLPADVDDLWNKRMSRVFDILMRHSDDITRVCAWGLCDSDSWKNNWPVKGRKDYPLLFDREYNVKPFLKEYTQPRKAVFSEFSYTPLVPEGLTADESVANPLLPGCHPDPSIVRVGEDYYLVNSSFSYFPGVPIWHSTDLKNWTRLGFVLNRQSQLFLPSEAEIRDGIYAPDISYNPANGKFYMITTLVRNNGGTFYVTTDDPKSGVWSDPVWLPQVGGIDPSILFDIDGKAYIVNNDAPVGTPRYDGHRAIFAHEFDWANDRVEGEPVCLLDGGIVPEENPVWIEGPHLYHVGDKYYLMCAEGGTSANHSEVVLVSDSPRGKFTPCPVNPILKAPSADSFPVTCTGHADLVSTPNGDWYAVFLAVRPYNGGHDICGRETFILPVDWSSGQPVIVGGDAPIPYHGGNGESVTLWDENGLANDAFFIRNQQLSRYNVSNGKLEMVAAYNGLPDSSSPSAVGRWATENAFSISTTLDRFDGKCPDDIAGLMIFHDDDTYVLFGRSVNGAGEPCVRLRACSNNNIVTDKEYDLASADKPICFNVNINGDGMYRFAYGHDSDKLAEVEETVSADLLSTLTSDNFTGTMVGLYATAK